MLKWIMKKLTKNSTEIPLFWVNYNRATKDKKNCMAHIHPNFKDDKVVIESLNILIDYIRENYNVKDL